jgi:hypothetical protein
MENYRKGSGEKGCFQARWGCGVLYIFLTYILTCSVYPHLRSEGKRERGSAYTLKAWSSRSGGIPSGHINIYPVSNIHLWFHRVYYVRAVKLLFLLLHKRFQKNTEFTFIIFQVLSFGKGRRNFTAGWFLHYYFFKLREISINWKSTYSWIWWISSCQGVEY